VESLYREAIALYEKLESESLNKPDYWRDLARSHNKLGMLLRNDGRKQEAEVELGKGQELWRKHPDPAIEQTKKAAGTQPNHIAVHCWQRLIESYYEAGDCEKCLWAFQKKEQVLLALGWGFSGWEGFYGPWPTGNWTTEPRPAIGFIDPSAGWTTCRCTISASVRLKPRPSWDCQILGIGPGRQPHISNREMSISKRERSRKPRKPMAKPSVFTNHWWRTFPWCRLPEEVS